MRGAAPTLASNRTRTGSRVERPERRFGRRGSTVDLLVDSNEVDISKVDIQAASWRGMGGRRESGHRIIGFVPSAASLILCNTTLDRLHSFWAPGVSSRNAVFFERKPRALRRPRDAPYCEIGRGTIRAPGCATAWLRCASHPAPKLLAETMGRLPQTFENDCMLRELPMPQQQRRRRTCCRLLSPAPVASATLFTARAAGGSAG